MLDKRLFKLAKFIENNEPFENLSDYFGMSQRTIYRLLAKWEKEKYISLNTRVHSNKTITLNIDIEKSLFIELVTNVYKLSMDEIQEYINLPWHIKTKLALQEIIRDKLSIKDYEAVDEKNKIIDYVFFIPDQLKPNEDTDIVTGQISSQVFEKLYIKDENMKLDYNLVKYDIYKEGKLHIFLHNRIKFSDGSLLTSKDVFRTIMKLKQIDAYKKIFNLITDIKINDDFSLILSVPRNVNFVKYILSEEYAGITKFENDHWIGTGPYKIIKKSENMIKLEENLFYRRVIDIQEVYLIAANDTLSTEMVEKDKYNVEFETYASHESLMFNPQSDLKIQHREYITKVLQNILLNLPKLSLLKYEYLYEKNKIISKPDFQRKIKILVNEFTIEKFNLLREELNKNDIEVEFLFVPYNEFIINNINQYDIDLLIISECYWDFKPYNMITLLLPSKFSEWFWNLNKTQEFIDSTNENDYEKVKVAGQVYESWLVSNYYRIELLKKYKKIKYSNRYKNIIIDNYGIVDYSRIIYAEDLF